ncbi:MAG: hypothetical protein JNL18_11055 [Planctomycetaceae bacterium]|nr:hypothetical protein [Planctomycetaceae bacterium]
MSRRAIMLTRCLGLAALVCLPSAAPAAHQTPTTSPIDLTGNVPYKIGLREVDFGAAPLPLLHSYAAGTYDGKWVLLSGRSNGVHDLAQSGQGSFPPAAQNRDVWVIDPVTKQSWHRSLGDPGTGVNDPASGLSPFQILSLSATNNQFEQVGDRLYVSGGYGLNASNQFTTFDMLTAIDLPGMVDWVVSGSGQAVDHLRQLNTPVASVTGGAMYEMGGRMHIVFGQDFEGDYSPRSDGTYTRQVRSFDVVDDGTTLAIANVTQTTPNASYRRRDLNVIPTLRPDGADGVAEGLVALSGVFTSSFGVWTVPVEIDADGTPTMANINAPDAFKQGFNGYHSAKLGMYSAATGVMNEVLFGGISLQYYDQSLGQVVTDDNMPFVNDVTSVVIDANGDYSQHHLGFFPEIFDDQGKQWRFGANAEFFAAAGIPTFDNGVIDLDQLTGKTSLGFIFGGIATNGRHTQGNPDVTSTASYHVFEVVYTPVPEANSLVLALTGIGALCLATNQRLAQRRLFGQARKDFGAAVDARPASLGGRQTGDVDGGAPSLGTESQLNPALRATERTQRSSTFAAESSCLV